MEENISKLVNSDKSLLSRIKNSYNSTKKKDILIF